MFEPISPTYFYNYDLSFYDIIDPILDPILIDPLLIDPKLNPTLNSTTEFFLLIEDWFWILSVFVDDLLIYTNWLSYCYLALFMMFLYISSFS